MTSTPDRKLSNIIKDYSEMHIDYKNSEKISWLLIIVKYTSVTFRAELHLGKNNSGKTFFLG